MITMPKLGIETEKTAISLPIEMVRRLEKIREKKGTPVSWEIKEALALKWGWQKGVNYGIKGQP